jgi:hypothetical protein
LRLRRPRAGTSVTASNSFALAMAACVLIMQRRFADGDPDALGHGATTGSSASSA